MSLNTNDEQTNEVYNELTAQFNKLININNDVSLEYYKKLSKDVFGLMMRGHYGRQTRDKFQPCQDEINLLFSMPKAALLCDFLRNRAGLKGFLDVLWPENDGLDEKDSIFHLHDSIVDNRKEFDDLKIRAKRLAKVITVVNDEVFLLDGHGRMLLCILNAFREMKRNINSIKFKLFEISEVVHEYHKLVMPKEIEKVYNTIIDVKQVQSSAVIYLNFCSIPSINDCPWTDHFENQTIGKWVYACCKENVLKYIWQVTTRQTNPCTVMISFVVKDCADGEYFTKVRETLGVQLTGLGFLYLLRRQDLFDAEIVSIRGKSGIEWADKDQKRKPKKLVAGRRGCPFVTLLVKPNVVEPTSLKHLLSTKGIPFADTREELIQSGADVFVTAGKYRERHGKVASRTLCEAHVWLEGVNGSRKVNISKLHAL